PLQERGYVLDLDLTRANTASFDYDSNDIESQWGSPSKMSLQRVISLQQIHSCHIVDLFAVEDDSSLESIQKNRNTCYQKQTTNMIAMKTSKILSLITAALNIHLNIGQNTMINTSTVFLSSKTASLAALSKKFIQSSGNAYIRVPLTLH
ncbi:unnamed protein product, partial [Rotaria sp. Silwood2]